MREHLDKAVQAVDDNLEHFAKMKVMVAYEYYDIAKLLEQDGATSDSESWQSTLRAYHGENGFYFKFEDHEIPYGYRFLGDFELLAYTPLTKVLRQTCLRSLKGNKIAALRGPAGTGKTETMKDLCRMLGYEPIIVNCSD